MHGCHSRLPAGAPPAELRQGDVDPVTSQPSPQSCASRILATVLLPITLIGCEKKPPPRPAAIPVTIAVAEHADVPLLLEATGTVAPLQSVAVQAQVGGVLTRVGFTEGQDVTRGMVLFEIDPRPYQTALDQARASLAGDRARLAQARRDQVRMESLGAQEFVTQQQMEQARSSVAVLTASLQSDSAAVERATLDLQNATIRSPISGRAGALLLREGNLVRANSANPLVVINQMRPIQARFAVPAQYLAAIRHRAADRLEVVATSIAESAVADTGQLVFLDNAVDSLSGTVTLKATFANPRETLWPGSLVRVSLRLDIQKDALVVPRAAVASGQNGEVIWVIDSASTAHLRHVTVERSTDSLAVLVDGVEAGERVVVDGQLRLTEGATVAVRKSGQGS